MPGLTMSTRDPDEAAAAGGDVFFPHRLDVRHARPRFRMSLSAATLGPVSAGVLGYSGEVVLQTGELETGYEVNVPLTGHLHTWIGSDEVCATPTRAALYPPDRPARLHGWSDGGGLFGMKIERSALEDRLRELTDGRASGPVCLGRSLDLAEGPGRQWWALARSLVDLTTDPDGPLARPIVARPLADALISALLHVADHPYRDLVHARPPLPRPSTIQAALDLIETEPERAWTVPDIAAETGLSVRALQHGFARHVGRSPTAQLRHVRLARAHDELRAADPARVTVAAVAARWGFVHLGRFAAQYRRRYDRTPSEDLRS
ncbi:MAG: AraC family transcriptional regulator [Actinomycetota bacterium]|nr:AraC family transcriptional regulator [Actinomycetota bacterium]